MRPRRVQLEGFSTFREKTEIEFGDADLLAFVGPTGSGKSSIIDALTFALYGSVARYDDARLVAPVISQAANEAKVRLDFELGARRYTAVRVVRRTKTGASTREARLERHGSTDDEPSEVLAATAKEVTEEVERLLGLDFTQFTRTVVLPQGDFAEFLTDDPASRQKLLRRLLDLEIYSRMGAMARDRAKAAGQRSEVYQGQLAQHADVSPTVLAELGRRAKALAEFVPEATAQLSALSDVEVVLVDLRSRVGTIDTDLDRLAQVQVPEAAIAGSRALHRAEKALADSREALSAARTDQQEAEEAVAAAGDVRALEVQLEATERLGGLADEIGRLEAAELELAEVEKTNSSALTEAETRAQRLQDLLSQARVGADAGAWVARLAVDAPCPVCRQTVHELPAHDPSAELEAAEHAWRRADDTASAARKALHASTTESTRLRARLDERRQERQTLAASMVDRQHDPSPLELGARLSRAREASATLATTTSKVRELERSITDAERAVKDAEGAALSLRQAFGEQRDSIVALGPPSPTGVSLAEDWRELAQWAESRRVALQGDRSRVADDGKEAADRKAGLLTSLRHGALPLELDPDPGLLLESLTRARVTVDAETERVAERLAQLEGWRAEVLRLDEEKAVHDTLGRHLSASGFERWLLAEALDDLVTRATVRLLELSGGQYSLASDNGVFRIIDHRNADEQRDVRTLSGGETFLASLALALALADSIGELAPVDAPRLESMFLDEGFGTLDAETLDVVASAIEELSAGGRLVGIVTHIEALAERMPQRIVVSKGPTTSTVEMVGP